VRHIKLQGPCGVAGTSLSDAALKPPAPHTVGLCARARDHGMWGDTSQPSLESGTHSLYAPMRPPADSEDIRAEDTSSLPGRAAPPLLRLNMQAGFQIFWTSLIAMNRSCLRCASSPRFSAQLSTSSDAAAASRSAVSSASAARFRPWLRFSTPAGSSF